MDEGNERKEQKKGTGKTMRSFRKWRAVWSVILLSAALSGCGTAGQKPQMTSGQEQEKQQDGEDSGTASADGTVVMAVGDETVFLTEAKTYAYFLKRQYDSNIGNAIWKYQIGDGLTFESYAKEQIQEMLTQIKIMKQEARRAEIFLSDDEEQEASEYAGEYMEGVSEDEKKEWGVSVKSVAEVFRENMLAQKFFEVSTNDVSTDIKDEEVRQITVQYLMIMTEGSDKNDIKVKMDKDEKKAAKKKAKKLWKDAKKTEDFRTLAENNSDAKDIELTFSKADGPEEFAEAAFALSSGQLSDVIEGKSGYYIIYCVNDDDEDATQQKKEELIAQRQQKEFQKKYKKWSSGYAVVISKNLWKQIKL